MCFPGFRKAFDTYSQEGNRHALKGFDLLRGLAAAAVAMGHGFWFSHPMFDKTGLAFPQLDYASKAVGIFAVLSGFLIYRSVAAINSPDGLKKYAVKRFFRIYPIYFVSVLLCAGFAQYVGFHSTIDWKFFFNDLFMQRLFPISQGANPVYWTLYAEVLFYVVLPIVVLSFKKRLIPQVCTLLLAYLIVADGGDRYLGLCKYFVFGVLAAELAPRLKNFSLLFFIVGALLCIYDFGGPQNDWVAKLNIGSTHPLLDTFGLGIGCAMMVAALPNLPKLGKIMDVFPLRFLGVISYSVYLTHMIYLLAILPSLSLLRTVNVPCAQALEIGVLPKWFLPLVFLPGVLFWSFVSYVLVERPGIMLGRLLLNNKVTPPPPPVRLKVEEDREPVIV